MWKMLSLNHHMCTPTWQPWHVITTSTAHGLYPQIQLPQNTLINTNRSKSTVVLILCTGKQWARQVWALLLQVGWQNGLSRVLTWVDASKHLWESGEVQYNYIIHTMQSYQLFILLPVLSFPLRGVSFLHFLSPSSRSPLDNATAAHAQFSHWSSSELSYFWCLKNRDTN